MKRLKVDRRAGLLRLGVDNLDDLWTLRNLIQVGDRVTSSTVRTAEAADDKLRAGKAEKKRMTIGVRVEEVEFHDFADHLRVLGTIETGPQDHGRHHTLVFTDDHGTQLTIEKPSGLLPWHLEAIDDAVTATKRPQVVLLAIDDEEAQFALLKSYGIQMLGSLPAGGQGKAFGDPAAAKAQFYGEATKTLEALRTNHDVPFIVVGPGWWREEFLAHVKAKDPGLADGAVTEGTGQGGRAGIHEAVKRGLVERVARDHRVLEESRLVEEVFIRIAKGDDTAAYGVDAVRQAVDAGAAERILVTDHLVRETNITPTLEAAGRVRCHVQVVASNHDAGHRLHQLGGVAALLRYSVA